MGYEGLKKLEINMVYPTVLGELCQGCPVFTQVVLKGLSQHFLEDGDSSFIKSIDRIEVDKVDCNIKDRRGIREDSPGNIYLLANFLKDDDIIGVSMWFPKAEKDTTCPHSDK